MSRNRRITDPSDVTTPHEAQQFANASTRLSVEYDCYGTKNTYGATVLIAPLPLDASKTNALYGIPAGESSDDITRFQFRARILDGDVPSPHNLLPDPCSLDTATSTRTILNLIKEHTLFISEAGYSGPVPQIGDIVQVRLEPGDIKQNLQIGTFLKIINSSTIEPVVLLSREACTSLVSRFDDFDEGDTGTITELSEAGLDETYVQGESQQPGQMVVNLANSIEDDIGLVHPGPVVSHVDHDVWDVPEIVRAIKSEYVWWRSGRKIDNVWYYPSVQPAGGYPRPYMKSKCSTTAVDRAAHLPFSTSQRGSAESPLSFDDIGGCYWVEPSPARGSGPSGQPHVGDIDGAANDRSVDCIRLNRYWDWCEATGTIQNKGNRRGKDCRGSGGARTGATTVECKNICAVQAWSAAFISYCMLKGTWSKTSQANAPGFRGSGSHTYYSIYAKENRASKTPQSYWLFVLGEENVKVELGDVVVGPATYDGAKYDSSHGDIVGKIEGNIAYCYGGNLSDTVKANSKTLELNDDGTFKRVNGSTDKYNMILKFIGSEGTESYIAATTGVRAPVAAGPAPPPPNPRDENTAEERALRGAELTTYMETPANLASYTAGLGVEGSLASDITKYVTGEITAAELDVRGFGGA